MRPFCICGDGKDAALFGGAPWGWRFEDRCENGLFFRSLLSPDFLIWIPPTAVEIRGQRRPLRFLQNNSVLYAGTKKHLSCSAWVRCFASFGIPTMEKGLISSLGGWAWVGREQVQITMQCKASAYPNVSAKAKGEYLLLVLVDRTRGLFIVLVGVRSSITHIKRM